MGGNVYMRLGVGMCVCVCVCVRERDVESPWGENTSGSTGVSAYKSILMAVKNDKSQTLQHCRKRTNIPESA